MGGTCKCFNHNSIDSSQSSMNIIHFASHNPLYYTTCIDTGKNASYIYAIIPKREEFVTSRSRIEKMSSPHRVGWFIKSWVLSPTLPGYLVKLDFLRNSKDHPRNFNLSKIKSLLRIISAMPNNSFYSSLLAWRPSRRCQWVTMPICVISTLI